MKAFGSVLFALSGLSRAIALDDETPCTARAWVRAPDLEPGKIIQGDVRVKLNGSCDDVSSYSVGLRFAERSWVKTRRAEVKLPERPTPSCPERRLPTNFSSKGSVYDSDPFAWRHFNTPEVDVLALEKYENDLKDPALWLVREEERVGFEAKYVFPNGKKMTHDATESFAILVPHTNYPPAFDRTMSSSGWGDIDVADAEHIYRYFVDVTFVNGTQREVPAGYTSFNAITTPIPGPETVNITMMRGFANQNQMQETDEVIPKDEFTLEVTFPSGRHLEQGSIHNITIISHQLGPGLQRPVRIQDMDTYVRQKRTWAANLASDNETAKTLLQAGAVRDYQLRPTPDDKFRARRSYSWETESELPQFPQDGVVQNGTTFTTDAVIAALEVPEFYPSFEMFYQTSDVELLLNLAVRNLSSEGANLPHADMPDDEYDWTPIIREEIYQPVDVLRARIPVFVHKKYESDQDRAMDDVIHYLSPEARAPIFVDPSSVTELLRKTAKDRNSLAPRAQAKFVAQADENVVKHRYHGSWGAPLPGSYYVGNTWLRKVVMGQREEKLEQGDTLVVQG